MTSLIFIVVCTSLIFWFAKRIARSRPPIPTPAGRSFHTKVVGVTFNNQDGINRQKIIAKHCRAGQKLELRPEPDNPKDPDALGVWGPGGQLGYIESGRLAQDLIRHIHAGDGVTATVASITGSTKDHQPRGVNMLIFISTNQTEKKTS